LSLFELRLKGQNDMVECVTAADMCIFW
jgi:hypothetical protein